MKTVIVTGAGDDVIQLDGDAKDEFLCYKPDGARLTFSEGTVIHARFFDKWTITVETQGAAGTKADQAPVPHLDREYTDRVIVTSDNIAWVEIDDDGGQGPRRITL